MRQIKIHHHNHLLIGSIQTTKKIQIYNDEMIEEKDVI